MIGIQITSNRAKFIKQANDTASVFRRLDVQHEVKRSLAKEIRQLNKHQFNAQGIGESGKWKKLKPATIKRKGHSQILYDSGHLYRQATRGGSVRSGFASAFRAFVFSFTINTKPSGLLRWIQKGTSKMPARPIFDPNEQQQAKVTAAIWTAVVRAYRKIGWFDRITQSRAPITGFDRIDIG